MRSSKDRCVECGGPAGHRLVCDDCAEKHGYGANDNRERVTFSDDVDPASREGVEHG